MLKILSFLCIAAVFISVATGSGAQEDSFYRLENPVNVDYLQKHLAKSSPKLILTRQVEKELKTKLKTDLLVKNYFNYLKSESERILTEPLLKHELEGFRLLAVSRKLVERMTILCMVYRIEKSEVVLRRIDEEISTVCAFEDWNTQHYLDVAEMSFGVALGIDWAGQWLPKETVSLAKKALIENGIKPSFNESGTRMGWINGTNNWNAVCHGGMIAASLMIADLDPVLAAKTISRALDKLPGSLNEYAPDGVYPEGPTYWGYGTSYTVVAANTLESALGSDFGISQSPGFMESVDFLLQVTAPSGDFFNFADSGDSKGGSQSVLMTWFAAKTGDAVYFDRQFFQNPVDADRFAGLALVWLSQFTELKKGSLPLNWVGKGKNPVAVFRTDKNDTGNFYLAVKGGKANLSHGNMDAGTFVFELDGVRWVIDPGNQSYYPLNRIGFPLSDHSQNGERWTLLTKKNQGHSTITVNDARFDVDGKATIVNFKEGEKPEVTIDMTDLCFHNINSLQRRFVMENNRNVLIEDRFEINDSTGNIVWGLMTTADVTPVENGAILRKDGKELNLLILENENLNISVISLDPPPMEIDKTIENLKRIEISIPAWTVKNREGKLMIRLSGN